MLAKRIIGSLILQDGVVVQSIGMSRYLPVGSPEVAVEFLDQWGADEIVVLEIGERRARQEPDFALVEALSKKCSVPLSIGGGINSLDTMRRLIQGGADKLVINRAALERPEIISEAAAVFGNQCIIVSIDVQKGGEPQAVAQAVAAATLGAGEILLRSAERDGAKSGYDVALVRAVANAVSVPVIAAGGCGAPQHIAEVFEAGAEAAAVGNYFHFTEQSVNTTKAALRAQGVPVRLDTYADYQGFAFDKSGRPAKRDDAYLEKLRFEYHPPEII